MVISKYKKEWVGKLRQKRGISQRVIERFTNLTVPLSNHVECTSELPYWGTGRLGYVCTHIRACSHVCIYVYVFVYMYTHEYLFPPPSISAPPWVMTHLVCPACGWSKLLGNWRNLSKQKSSKLRWALYLSEWIRSVHHGSQLRDGLRRCGWGCGCPFIQHLLSTYWVPRIGLLRLVSRWVKRNRVRTDLWAEGAGPAYVYCQGGEYVS